MGKHIGKSVKRVEDPRFIQGQGKYVACLLYTSDAADE